MDQSLDTIITLSFDLTRVIRHMMVSVAQTSPRLNFLQIHALVLITERPGMTMKELAECLRVSSPSATTFVSRLVHMGLIDRVRDAGNRKLVRLQVTRKGKNILRVKWSKRTALIKRYLRTLTPREQGQFAHILRKLTGVLEESALRSHSFPSHEAASHA